MWFPDVARLPVWLIVAVGLALRVIWALIIPVEPISDAAAYQIFATNIVEHGVYGFTPDQPGAYWAVGPAAIYAFGYLIFGIGSDLSVVLLNLISSALVIWGLCDLGARWFNTETGRWAALLFAIWPLTIQFTTVLASELHFMALIVLALAAWTRSGVSWRGALFLITAGLCFAGATYVRPTALLVPTALALAALVLRFRHAWQDWLKAGLVTVMIFALVSPWSARNEQIFGEPVFMSTNFWPNFWMGNHAGSPGTYVPLPPKTNGMSEIERSDYVKALVLEDIQAAPAEFVGGVLWKAFRLHDRETIGVVWNEGALNSFAGPAGVMLAKAVSTGFWYVVLALAFAGIVALWRSGQSWHVIFSPTVWLWLYFTGVHAVIVVGDRYHMPAIPLIALLAGAALQSLTLSRGNAEASQNGPQKS